MYNYIIVIYLMCGYRMYSLDIIHHILPVVTLLYILLICFPAINHTSSISSKVILLGCFPKRICNISYPLLLILSFQIGHTSSISLNILVLWPLKKGHYSITCLASSRIPRSHLSHILKPEVFFFSL